MKCNDCGCNRAYTKKGLAWRLCRDCWVNLLAILSWASEEQGPGSGKVPTGVTQKS